MQKVAVSNIAKQIRGVSYKPVDLHNDLNKDSVILLRANNISGGKINFDDVVYVDKKKVSSEQYLQKGDILICASSGSKNLVGKAASVSFDIKCTFGAFCKVIRPISKYANYLGMYFQSDIYRRIISNVAIGANINNIRNEHIDSLELSIYSDDKNNEIVSTLDTLQSIITHRRTQLEKLDLLVKARFVEMFGDPVINPYGWEMRRLQDVCKKLTDGTHFSPKSFSSGDYKYITAKNIKIDGFDFTGLSYVPEAVHRSIYERCNPEYGDILYIKDGATTGIAMINTLHEEFTILSSIALIKYDRSLLNGIFLKTLMNSQPFYAAMRNNMGGAAITRLTVKKLCDTIVLVPPLALQKQLADFVKQVDKSKATVQKALDEAQLLFDSLMQEYFG